MLIQVGTEYNTFQIAIQYLLSNFNLLKNTRFNLNNLLLKMVKKRCTFKNLEENLKKLGGNSKNYDNLEEIKKTWRKFPKIFWPPCIH